MKTECQRTGARRFYDKAPGLFLLGLCVLVLLSNPAPGQLRRPITGNDRIHPTLKKVQQIYTAEIGVREKQFNSGPAVESYLRYVNLPKGNPWCAAFVCWVYGRAGVPNPRTGWSPDLFKKAHVIWERGFGREVSGIRISTEHTRCIRARGVTFLPDRLAGNAQPAGPGTGDVFGIFFAEKKRIAHVGFVDQWDGTWLITVEGNTNNSGSREGDGVYRKRRLVRTIYKVARYIK